MLGNVPLNCCSLATHYYKVDDDDDDDVRYQHLQQPAVHTLVRSLRGLTIADGQMNNGSE